MAVDQVAPSLDDFRDCVFWPESRHGHVVMSMGLVLESG